MKLTKLVVQNFLSIKDATLHLADKGLVSIEGENLDDTGSDSNGAGKSSIINAILWCLYGSYGKDEAADDVVNSETKKDCMVQCEWSDSGYEYRITRYRKHSKRKNAITIEIKHPSSDDFYDWTKAGAGAVQQQINEIMGADETVFRAACFAQQENPIDIPAMTDKELKQLLEKLLPFEELEEAHAIATEEITDLKAGRAVLQRELHTENVKLENCKVTLEEAIENEVAWLDTVLKKDSEIDTLVEGKRKAIKVADVMLCDVGGIRNEIEEYDRLITECGNTDISGAAAVLRMLQSDLERLYRDLENLDGICFACKQPIDISEQRRQLNERISAKEIEVYGQQSIYEKVSANHTQAVDFISLREELYDKLEKNAAATKTIVNLEADIKALEGQRLSREVNPHSATVKRLVARLRASEERIKAIEADIADVDERLELLEAAQLTFSPKGLRYHMLEKVAPTLTAYTNKYLNTLTNGTITAVWSTVTRTATGDYREKFSIEARMANRTKFGLLSGGQKRKVRLACFFALQDLIASRASKKIELWCGDEVDHALDEAGLERLMVLLEEKARDKATILVISHNQLREWIPNYATVTMKDGVSTITGYLNG